MIDRTELQSDDMRSVDSHGWNGRSSTGRGMGASEADELAEVVRSLATNLRGDAAAVTLHPDHAGQSTIVHVEGHPHLPIQMIGDLLALPGRGRRGDASFAWLEPIADATSPAGQDGIVLPMDRVVGHDRLAVTIFFNDLGRGQRPSVEAAYGSHRFTQGYFRLWQIDRVTRRTIAELKAALDLTAVGMMLLDRAGSLVFANQAAHRLFAAGDGLRERQGLLQAAGLADGARLQAAINHVTGRYAELRNGLRAPMLTIQRPNRSALVLLVVPAAGAATHLADVVATVLAVDPHADNEQLLEPICKLFKLSQVETRLTCQIAVGATLTEAAVALRLKEQTARGYLKQIFLKTGTNRQSELVRMVLSRLVRTFEPIQVEIV